MNEIVTTIAAAVEEQSVTTRDIAENVGQGIRWHFGNQPECGNQFGHDTKIHGYSSGSHVFQEMNSNSEVVRLSSQDLAKLADLLKDLTSRFKV